MNIKNKAINTDTPSAVTTRNRNQVIDALLYENPLKITALKGSQCVSIVKSVLINTGLFVEQDMVITPEKSDLYDIFEIFSEYIDGCQTPKSVNGLKDSLYSKGVTIGIMPLLIASFLHSFKRQIYFLKNDVNIRLDSGALQNIIDNPSDYTVLFKETTQAEIIYLSEMDRIFQPFIDQKEKRICDFSHLTNGMLRWYLNLSNYSKQFIAGQDEAFIKQVKKAEINPEALLFKKIPADFKCELSESAKRIEKLCNSLKQADTDLYAKIEAVIIENKAYTIHERLPKEQSYSLSDRNFLQAAEEKDGEKIGRIITGLYPLDWSVEIFEYFTQALYKTLTRLEYGQDDSGFEIRNAYTIIYMDNEGKVQAQTFPKTDCSEKGRLLYNEITNSLSEMGQSISVEEKKQILIDALETV